MSFTKNLSIPGRIPGQAEESIPSLPIDRDRQREVAEIAFCFSIENWRDCPLSELEWRESPLHFLNDRIALFALFILVDRHHGNDCTEFQRDAKNAKRQRLATCTSTTG